jgi:(1->4)-alpha-D-glucan 1-alpha-D-glucosylmutase
MLTTATHDHKRGADTRMRLAVLSEIPATWGRALHAWQAGMTAQPSDHDAGSASINPDAVDQSMLFQTLVGAWPLSLPASPGEMDRETWFKLIQRVSAWQTKTLREAKRHSSWIVPNESYEAACAAMLQKLAQQFGRTDSTLVKIGRLVHKIAAVGALNSLAQTTLHLTAPGVPDIYQGTESWDFSLVDPDNRRPVDFAALSVALSAEPSWHEVLTYWRDGRIKQKLVHTLLKCRRAHAELFASGDYLPLQLDGLHAARALAFARRHAGQTLIVVVGRLAAPLLGLTDMDTETEAAQEWDAAAQALPRVEPAVWRDTAVVLPAGASDTVWHDVLTGISHDGSGTLELSALLRDLPVAVLLA